MPYDGNEVEHRLQLQLQLEQNMRINGVARYRQILEKARKNKDESSVKPTSHLLDNSVGVAALAVEAFFSDASSGKAGKRATAYTYIKALEPEVVAFLALRIAFDSVSRERSLISTARGIGRSLEDELRFRAFDREKPGLWFTIVKSLTEQCLGTHRRNAEMKRASVRYDVGGEPWGSREQFLVGMKCIDILIQSTGMFEITTYLEAKNRKRTVFKATAETLTWINTAHQRCELMAPIYTPMIVSPVDWTTPFDGGYISNAVKREPMIQSRNSNYLEELSNWEMPMVYDAINAVQRTSWQINHEVHTVIKALWDMQTTMGGLPSVKEEYLPQWYEGIDSKSYRRSRAIAHVTNSKRRSRRIACAKALWVAEEFAQYDEFYFPHYCDFRGRLYARPLFLNPQGPDYAKGLLRFAVGKPLGEEGAAWLAVHGANTWGFDKVSLDDRVKWTEENEENILASARDPLEHKWWTDADKPFQFLAFCLEWAGFRRDGFEFRSQLPVALDGSCNGLQHFSMSLRDEVGGAAVNLSPADKPSDIYQQVADVVVRKAIALDTEMSRSWVTSGLITRKLCKRPVMTLPYGAKKYGMRSGIAEYLDEVSEETQLPWAVEDRFQAGTFIGGLIWDSINEVVVAARSAMDFLQRCAQVAAKEGLPIHWVAPSGFPVIQEYRSLIGKVVETQISGERMYLTLSSEGDVLDKKRQAMGVSPNFVHSLDSAHLMSTVVLSQNNGITHFAMIHDSYGTHACDTPVLGAALRQTFVEQYRRDVLAEFRETISEQLLPENRKELPPLPQKGTLDLEAVLDADFFFS